MEFKFLYGPEIPEAEQQLPAAQRVDWPIDSLVMYAFDDEGCCIGRMGLMSIKLIEGTWAAPDAPPTTAYRMLKQMEAAILELGNAGAFALSHDAQPEIADYLTRVGYERYPVTLHQKWLVAEEKVA